MKLVVPLTIPKTFASSVAAKLSWITRMIGIDAGDRRLEAELDARPRGPPSKSSSPCWASSCLFAVTTGLPARSAAST